MKSASLIILICIALGILAMNKSRSIDQMQKNVDNCPIGSVVSKEVTTGITGATGKSSCIYTKELIPLVKRKKAVPPWTL